MSLLKKQKTFIYIFTYTRRTRGFVCKELWYLVSMILRLSKSKWCGYTRKKTIKQTKKKWR